MTKCDQRGAATVLVLAMAGVLLLVGAALGVVAGMVRAERAAQSAADLAALAGAQAAQQGGDACAKAADIAAANDARLTACATQGFAVTVSVTVAGPHWLGQSADLSARARAGPDQPDPSPSHHAGSGGGLGATGASASRTSSRSIAPFLSSGLFWLPHFGDCTHDGQPSGHSHDAMVSRVALSQASAAAKPRALIPAPPA